MCDYVQIQSLDWAIKSVDHYGDTDIFPTPFEYDAVKGYWPEIRAHLSNQDLSMFSPSASLMTLMPKPDGTFRVAKQLNPLDSLLYLAILYEIAPNVEGYRVSKDSKVACSYRIDIQPEGRIFQEDNGWDDFHQRSKSLAESGQFSCVLIIDIADFYNQISHHRIENVLELANITKKRSKNIESFLGALTTKFSKGLPVGPVPSIVLAEACLDDVDKRLLSKNVKFTRYVDDFRIFCESMDIALKVLQDLTEYFYTSHRLTFQSHKTDIFDVGSFLKKELKDPKEEEEKKKVESINDLIEDFEDQTGYVITEDDIDSDMRAEVTISNLSSLFEQCLDYSSLRLGFARYLLRKATRLRTRKIYPMILANLQYLSPVFREVCLYFQKTLNAANTGTAKESLGDFLFNNDYGKLPYVRMWALDLFAKNTNLLSFEEALSMAEDSRMHLGLRPAALLAREYKNIDWVRGHKENWNCHNSWERRAIIWAASVLPMDERKPWLGTIKDTTSDILEKAVAIKSLTF